MLKKIEQCAFPVIIMFFVMAISLFSFYREEKTRYKPEKNTIYKVVSRDRSTGLSICSCGKNNFKLLKIPEDITNEMSFVKSFSGYKIVNRNNN